MTADEAIKRMRNRVDTITNIIGKGFDGKAYEDMEMAIQALEEVQQYRAIGTVEECREARERQRGKKPVKDECSHDCCPNCGWVVYKDEWGGRYLPHCENCGQAIKWDE